MSNCQRVCVQTHIASAHHRPDASTYARNACVLTRMCFCVMHVGLRAVVMSARSSQFERTSRAEKRSLFILRKARRCVCVRQGCVHVYVHLL